MPTPPLPPPTLVADPDSLGVLVRALAPCDVVAVDTESNSLHAYRERVCLLQFSTPDADYLVDPIALPDLTPLAPFFANPDQQKIFHAAEGDLIGLRRDFDFDCANLFDTMVAARTLGWPRVGLAAILEASFGVTLNKRFQRSDWKRRPLSPEQLDYARLDTHFLLPLRDQQLQALTEAGCWDEVHEEFLRLASARHEKDLAVTTSNAFWRVKGARDLPPTHAAVLQALYAYRETHAERQDRPPFKVMSEATLLDLVRRQPTQTSELAPIAGMTPEQIRRHGAGVLQAIRDGLRAPAPHAPALRREPDDVRDRYDRLHAWRKNRARARGVESDVILPRTTLWDLARRPPVTADDLTRVTDLGPWRRGAYGTEILALLAGTATAPPSVPEPT